MASITKYGIKFHSDFKLLPKGFAAITLFGHVFCTRTKEQLPDYLNSPRGKVLANHEHWHLIQAESFMPWGKNLGWLIGYITFYLLYIMFWIKNLFVCGFNKSAYYNIPFEKEAYGRQLNFNDPDQKTHWKDYI